MKKLYPHQVEAVAKVRAEFAKGFKRVCLQASTGMGKTVVAIHIIAQALAKGKKVLFLVHVKELIDQTAEEATEEGLSYSYIAAADYPFLESAKFQIASTQTVSRRLENLTWRPDFIVYDEFHHACSKTSLKILNYYKDVPLLGLTATPKRLDGKGLDMVADSLVTTISTKELIRLGFLSQYEYYAPPSGIDFEKIHIQMGDYNSHELEAEIDRTQIFGKVVENYQRYLDGEPAICFALTRKHSIKLVNEFLDAGIPAAHIDSDMPKSERRKVIQRYHQGLIKVLSNVAIATEGFDMPACSGVFIVRATMSETLFLQMVGRGLRKSGDKICKIFDHVENYKRHGMPDEEREWSLAGSERKASSKKVPRKPVITCSHCNFTYPVISPRICPKCGNQERAIAKEMEHTEGLLQKVTEHQRKNTISEEKIVQMKRACKTLADFEALAKKLNYKPGWARLQMEFRNKWLQKFAK